MSATSDLIQKIYIGYFGRAGDPEGLNYWVEQSAAGLSDAAIAQSFSVQDEATDMYGFLAAPSLNMGRVEFLNSVYQNLFGRDMDAEGEEYWIGQLDAGRPVGGIILDIINGAQNSDEGQDLTVITNKLAAANYYTEKVITSNATWTLADDQQDAIDVLSEVDATAASVTAAEDLADELVAADTAPAGQTFTLTAGADDVDGGAGNDTINGLVDSDASSGETFTAADVIAGGGGTDTLNLTYATAAAAAMPAATISGVENFSFKNQSGQALSVDFSLITGEASVTSNVSTSAVTTTGMASGTTAAVAGNGAATNAASSFGWAAAATSATVAIQDGVTAGAVTTVGTGLTSQTVTSTGAANTIGALAAAGTVKSLTINATTALTTGAITNTGGAAITTLTLSGAGAIDVDAAALEATVTKVDASGSTGGVAVQTGTGTITVTGGSGNDTLDVSGSATALNLDAGAGNDAITLADSTETNFTSADTINGGDGTDTITVDVDLVDAAAVTTALTKVTNVETLNLVGFGDANTVNVADIASSLNRVNLSAVSGAFNNTVNFAAGSSTVGINIAAAVAAGQTLTVDAAGSGASDALTITNMLTTGNMGSATSNITTTDYETVAINTGSYTTASVQDLGVISAGTAAVSVSGSNGLTIAAGFVGGSLDASGITGGTTKALIMGAATTVTSITGSAGHDTIIGDASATLSGLGGNDAITGGANNDTISGGDGNDTIVGAAGVNTITGDAGDDSITASTGNDTIDAGAGNDIIIIAGDQVDTNDSLVGGDGSGDILELNTAALTSVLGGQKISGFEIFSVATTGLTQDLSYFQNNAFTTARANGVATLTMTNAGADLNTVRVDASNTTISFDRLTDGASNSLSIVATANAALTTSFTAQDEETITIDSSDGTVAITSLVATDLTTLVINGDNNVTITAAGSSASVASVTNNLTGTATFTANLSAGTVANTVSIAGSSTGTSTITTGSGADTVTAGSGALSATTGAGADTINGGSGADTIVSGDGADSITAGGGIDSITGGGGNDTIVLTETTAVADILVMTATGLDNVTGFAYGAAGDQLKFDISDLEAAYSIDFANLDDGASTADAEGLIQEVTADAAAVANATFFALVGSTFASTSDVEDALETGAFELTGHADVALGDGFLVAYSNGTDAFIALAKVVADSGANFAYGDLQVTNIVQLLGNSSITAGEFNIANFDFIA